MMNATCIDSDGDCLHLDDNNFDVPTLVIENYALGGYNSGAKPIESCYFHLSDEMAQLMVDWLCQRFEITPAKLPG